MRNVLIPTAQAMGLMNAYFGDEESFPNYSFLDNCGEPVWSKGSIATTPVTINFFSGTPVTTGAVTGNWHSDLKIGDCFMLICGIEIVIANAVRLVDLDMLEALCGSFLNILIEGKPKIRNLPLYKVAGGPPLREVTSSVAAIGSDVHVAGIGDGIFQTAIPYLPNNKIEATLNFNTAIVAPATAMPVDIMLHGPRLYKESAR